MVFKPAALVVFKTDALVVCIVVRMQAVVILPVATGLPALTGTDFGVEFVTAELLISDFFVIDMAVFLAL